MRIVEVKTIRDAENNIVKQDVTLGDFNRHNRYLERISQAAQVVGGLGGGFAIHIVPHMPKCCYHFYTKVY